MAKINALKELRSASGEELRPFFGRTEKRATREDIFASMRDLLGDDAIEVSTRVYKLALEKNYDASLLALKEYDAKLGGIGIYESTQRFHSYCNNTSNRWTNDHD